MLSVRGAVERWKATARPASALRWCGFSGSEIIVIIRSQSTPAPTEWLGKKSSCPAAHQPTHRSLDRSVISTIFDAILIWWLTPHNDRTVAQKTCVESRKFTSTGVQRVRCEQVNSEWNNTSVFWQNKRHSTSLESSLTICYSNLSMLCYSNMNYSTIRYSNPKFVIKLCIVLLLMHCQTCWHNTDVHLSFFSIKL